MKANIEDIKNKAVPILKKAGVTSSAIFGSYARGKNREDSDIDILVELPEDKTLFDFINLQLKLQKALGKKVDLGEYAAIKPRLKNYILNNQIQIL